MLLSSKDDCEFKDFEDEAEEELRRRRSGLIFVEERLVQDEDEFSWPYWPLFRRPVREESLRELVRRPVLLAFPGDPSDRMYLLRYDASGEEEERLAVLLLLFILGYCEFQEDLR